MAAIPSHPCFDTATLADLDVHSPDGEQVSLPTVTEQVRVDYPEAARIERASGDVRLEVLVLKSGVVADVCVLDESIHGVGFGQAAIDAVSRYRFEPASKDGVPVNAICPLNLSWDIP